MATDRLERTRRNEERRKRVIRKWAIRVIAGCLGAGLGEICDKIPEPWQWPCHISAKVFQFVGGQ